MQHELLFDKLVSFHIEMWQLNPHFPNLPTFVILHTLVTQEESLSIVTICCDSASVIHDKKLYK